MATNQLLIRCKTNVGQHTIESLTTESTVADLLICLEELTKVTTDRMKILIGFPPKPMYLQCPELKLVYFNIRSGDTIIIGEKKPGEEIIAEKPAYRVSDEVPKIENPALQSSGDNSNKEAEAASDMFIGQLMRYKVPANNSCLFSSVYYIVSGGDTEFKNSKQLRKIISETVEGNPIKFNEGFLGMPNPQYCTWIQNEKHWGGAIEISIMSTYYEIEIVAIDTQNLKFHHFGEARDYGLRIFLIYDGIHYDPLVREVIKHGVLSVQGLFEIEEDALLVAAYEIAREAKDNRQYTDLENFQLKCLQCQKLLHGQKEASQHALETQHCQFGEM